MKKKLLILILFITIASFGQSVKNENLETKFAFKNGEWLQYRMNYSNFLNAGYSTIEVKELKHNGKDAFHIIGHGKSTGLVSLFFKVRDDYQSYLYKENFQPFKSIRKIDEGGYTKDQEISFDYSTNEATVKNFKHNTVTKHPINSNIQDILSSLYYIRNQNISNLKIGDEIALEMFFDQEINNFKLRFLGKEIIKTKFGKVKTLKFMPLVQAGRVFKKQESVTIWISDDENKIPLLVKASLAVGSLRADLDEFKGLAHPFNIIFDN